jgi:hypothetical protein
MNAPPSAPAAAANPQQNLNQIVSESISLAFVVLRGCLRGWLGFGGRGDGGGARQ